MNRIGLINLVIEKFGYQRYLEIGCAQDVSFSKVQAPFKVGVDPTSGGTLRMGSDEFFALALEPFDLIFIDGNHQHHQVFRDVRNAIRLLQPDGTIIMHDCVPPTADYEGPGFCSTAWRAFAKIRERSEFEALTTTFDFGCGLVRIRPNTHPIRIDKSMDDLSYADLVANKNVWMRPHTAEQIEQIAESGFRSLPVSELAR